jgi:hypothetical protein
MPQVCSSAAEDAWHTVACMLSRSCCRRRKSSAEWAMLATSRAAWRARLCHMQQRARQRGTQDSSRLSCQGSQSCFARGLVLDSNDASVACCNTRGCLGLGALGCTRCKEHWRPLGSLRSHKSLSWGPVSDVERRVVLESADRDRTSDQPAMPPNKGRVTAHVYMRATTAALLTACALPARLSVEARNVRLVRLRKGNLTRELVTRSMRA